MEVRPAAAPSLKAPLPTRPVLPAVDSLTHKTESTTPPFQMMVVETNRVVDTPAGVAVIAPTWVASSVVSFLRPPLRRFRVARPRAAATPDWALNFFADDTRRRPDEDTVAGVPRFGRPVAGAVGHGLAANEVVAFALSLPLRVAPLARAGVAF